MKRTPSPKESESASDLIDRRIADLDDWRGDTLARLRANAPIPENARGAFGSVRRTLIVAPQATITIRAIPSGAWGATITRLAIPIVAPQATITMRRILIVAPQATIKAFCEESRVCAAVHDPS